MVNLSNHKAIILAGGKGSRLYPVTYEIPKPLLPVKKKPIINYLIELFNRYDIKEIAVLINRSFREEFLWWQRRYFDPLDSAVNIKFFEETEPLGTFGGIWHLKKWLGHSPFFLTNGDELKDVNLKKMADFHFQKTVLGTVALVKVPNPQDYGVVVCNNGLICEFMEKPENPPSNYINSGLYLFSSDILNEHPGPKFLMTEKDIFPELAQRQKLAGFKFKGSWMDCGTFERYESALKHWQES